MLAAIPAQTMLCFVVADGVLPFIRSARNGNCYETSRRQKKLGVVAQIEEMGSQFICRPAKNVRLLV